jgi:hypothetical protein
VSRPLALPRDDSIALAAGAALAVAGAMLVAEFGGIGIGAAVLASLFLVLVALFAYAPHLAVAGAIPFFVVLPALKILVTPLLGGAKDVVCIAAVVAAVMLFLSRRAERRPTRLDPVAAVLFSFLLSLYLVDLGGELSGEGGYGIAWFHGVRLFAEPLSLFFVGTSLRHPAKTYRWASASFVATAVFVGLVGLVQQVVKGPRLVALGYSYGVEVRTLGGHLRSFGTLGDPFSYAGILLFAAAVIVLRGRIRARDAIAFGVILAGILFSYERTALAVLLALIGLGIARRGHARTAVVFVLAGLAASTAFFVAASDTAVTGRVHVQPSRYLTLNGRTNVWSAALGSERAWIFGRGVGVVGRASQRAAESFSGVANPSAALDRGSAVDSAYPAAVADVGFVGLGLLVALFARLGALSWRAAARESSAGWVSLGLLVVMALDGLTRESFTAFPTAYVGLLLIGLATAAGRQPSARSNTAS